MSVDYDLVILGGSSVARYAAIAARRLKARVALVEPNAVTDLESASFHHSLLQAAQIKRHQGVERYGFHLDNEPTAISLERVQQRAIAIAQTQSESRSPSVLAALGIDVIFGQGEFYRRPQLGVNVKGRNLRSRAYLLAPGGSPVVPPIDGLAIDARPGIVSKSLVVPLTIESLSQFNSLQFNSLQSSGHMVVIGNEPRGLELAQAFGQLGWQVTLIIEGDRLLPTEDAEAAHLIQAQLEADGIHILTQTAVTQVKRLDGKVWIQAGHQVFEADEILLAMGQQPQLAALNLEAAGVKYQPWGIPVNTRLQTTQPRIYACGDVLGGYSLAQVAQSEAEVALRNALFYSSSQVNYHRIAWAIFTQPELARIGLTEDQARQQFGEDVRVLRQFSKTLPKAQLQGDLTGFCKLIVRCNGQILGAHLVGTAASETVSTIALAIQQNLPVKSLAQLGAIAPSWSELLQQTAAEWSDRSAFQQDLLESWFNLRRSWSR